MEVQTSRFGPVDVDASRIIEFPRGILGFPKYKSYVLIQPEADATREGDRGDDTGSADPGWSASDCLSCGGHRDVPFLSAGRDVGSAVASRST